jgi:hypothetical protein
MPEAQRDPLGVGIGPRLGGLDERVLEQLDGRVDVLDRERTQAQVATVSAPSSSEIATSIE